MKNIEKIKDTHKCFNCGRVFEWKGVYFNPPITSETVSASRKMAGNVGKITFTDQDTIEVEVACDECFNVNRFIYSK